MKNQAECWKAILEGKTLVNERRTEEVILKDGQAQGQNGIIWDFYIPESWSIKKEIKMYCRFKSVHGDSLRFTSYVEVGSPTYVEYKNLGVEC